jgi:UDP-N-acetylglucosamine--N-acetylmuramyl-(pentapeptide) pyrophosphoryl-undecaprenol N-acetylglucosamine transferase
MKIVITGGHFSPAYSVLQKLKIDNEILVVGRKYAFEGEKNETYEYKICKKNNIPFLEINAGRLQRVLTKHTIASLARFPKGVYQALRILKKEKPDIVVTFGGYIGLSVAIAAYLSKVPIVLHEQTQKAGLSSKLISRFANVICISFDSSRPFFRGKNVVLTGNPIREEILTYNESDLTSKDRPIIYITGGSTGSHAINIKIKEILPELLKKYKVFHQTGNSLEYKDYETLFIFKNSIPKELSENYILKQFFAPNEVAALLHNASLVISRSGINTVSELLAIGAVSLLVPLPHGQSDEQLDNAKLFKSTGLGEYLEQKEINAKVLLGTVNDMIVEQKKYKENSKKAFQLVHLDAAELIIQQIYTYGKGNKGGAERKV